MRLALKTSTQAGKRWAFVFNSLVANWRAEELELELAFEQPTHKRVYAASSSHLKWQKTTATTTTTKNACHMLFEVLCDSSGGDTAAYTWPAISPPNTGACRQLISTLNKRNHQKVLFAFDTIPNSQRTTHNLSSSSNSNFNCAQTQFWWQVLFDMQTMHIDTDFHFH